MQQSKICGYNLSKIREEGAEIKTTSGKASGPLSFLTLFDQTGEVISQASRRGAQIGLLDIDHPDIENFIHFKSVPNARNDRLLKEYNRNLNGSLNGTKYYDILRKTLLDDQLTHFNISVTITDDFMRAVENDEDWNLISPSTNKVVKTVKARELLKMIAEQCWESGDPGVLFTDRINEDNLVPYYGYINATNPCLIGDTLVQTVHGEIPIKDLVGKEIDVYCMGNDGELKISKATNIRKTKENAKLVKVITSRGELICTPDHKIHTNNRGWIEAKDLLPKDKVTGLIRSMSNEKYCSVWLTSNNEIRTKEHRLIAGYYQDILGKDVHHKDGDTLNNVLDNLEVMEHGEHSRLSNLGHPNWNKVNPKGQFEIKEDRKKKEHRILKEFPAGINLRVKEVIDLDYTEDVYDLEVPEYHNFIANRLVVHNCGEVTLFPGESCILGSINLHAFYNKKTKDINWEELKEVVDSSTRFLEDVTEISVAPVGFINETTKVLRRLGLGVMGFADLLVDLDIPYDSYEAQELARKLSWFISYNAWITSYNMAKERGAFGLYDKDKVNISIIEKTLYNNPYQQFEIPLEEVLKTGFRNVSVTSIAPTGSIAIIGGVNSGIEPFFALAYTRNITEGVGNIATDQIVEINPALENKLKDGGYTEEQIKEIVNCAVKNGTLSNCDIVSDEIKSVFKTADEISWLNHIAIQAAWQEYISNSISKTINCGESITPEEIYKMYLYMWHYNLKGGTIYRNNSKTFQILEKPKE